MSFLDKAKERASQLAAQAKEKVDDIKDNRKADDLLDDLGRISYRQQTGRAEEGDEAAIVVLVEQLRSLEADGTPVLGTKQERAAASNLPPPAAPSSFPPPTA
jgi:hypothetical protein